MNYNWQHMLVFVASLPDFCSSNFKARHDLRPSQSEQLEYFENGLTKNHKILQGHTLQQHQTRRRLLPVRSYPEKLSKIPTLMASGRISQE